MTAKIIATDFDGTLCEDKWPEIGDSKESIIRYLKEEKAKGAKLILWTCRSKEDLEDAVAWCEEQGLIFDAINKNVPEMIDCFGEDTRKIFANEYIDDRNKTIYDIDRMLFFRDCAGIIDVKELSFLK